MSKANSEPITLGPRSPAGSRPLAGASKHVERVRIFGADIDVAFGRPDRDPCNRHALDQQKRIAFHQHAIGESAAVAFVRVADDVFLVGLERPRRCAT